MITQEIVDKSIDKNPYEDFIPTTKLNFDKSPQEIDFDELIKFLGDDATILDVEFEVSTIIKIVLLSCENLEPEEIVQEHKNFVEDLKRRLNSSTENRAIIGNLVGEPITTSPEDQKINLSINKSSINQFQNTIELNKMEIKEIMKKVYEKFMKEKCNGNWKFVISYKDLYNDLEAQLRNDLENNPYEMIITEL